MSAEVQPAAPGPGKPPRFYLPGAALLALLILAPSLLYPFGRDQSVFAYVGSIIARGGMPFRDAWDLKPPGIYALYGLIAAVAPDQHEGLMLLVRIVDVTVAMGTAACIAALALRWGYAEAGWGAAAWFAAQYLRGGFWSVAQAEAFANLLVVAAVLLLLWRQGGGAAAAAGFLTGLAAALKFTTVAPVLLIGVLVLRDTPAGWPRRVLCFALGGAVSCGAMVLWLSRGGALSAYLDIQRGFVVPYARISNTTVANPLTGLWYWFLGVWPAILAAAGLFWASAAERRRLLPATLGLAAGIAAVVVQGKYFLYHWESTQPWLALLAGAGALALVRKMPWSGRQRAALLVLLPLAWILAARWGFYRDGARYAAGALSRGEWLARFRSPSPDYSFAADLDVARYVRSHTQAGDGVFIWGFEPSVYLFSDRRPPTRFFFNVPVAVPFTPPAWKEELLSDLQREKPALFLVVRNDAIPWANGLREDSEGQLRAWPELQSLLAQHYRFETRIEDFALYRRSDP